MDCCCCLDGGFEYGFDGFCVEELWALLCFGRGDGAGDDCADDMGEALMLIDAEDDEDDDDEDEEDEEEDEEVDEAETRRCSACSFCSLLGSLPSRAHCESCAASHAVSSHPCCSSC